MPNTDGTPDPSRLFDFSAYPADSLFYDRRSGLDRRAPAPPPRAIRPTETGDATPRPEHRQARKERRRRVDPTTFEKQYTEAELEFMTAMQEFKNRSGKPFPTHREVLQVAASLGYRRPVAADDLNPEDTPSREEELTLV